MGGTRSNTPNRIAIENPMGSIKITIHSRKKWGMFLFASIPLLFPVCILVIVFGLGLLYGLPQKDFPLEMKVGLLLGPWIFLYFIYLNFRGALKYVLDKEIIEIDDQGIRIEKSGFLNFKKKRSYHTEEIRGITSSFSPNNFFGDLMRSPLGLPNYGAFLLWTEYGRDNFGGGVSEAQAQGILDYICKKFPRYRYSGKLY
jgi:hypothetical protein